MEGIKRYEYQLTGVSCANPVIKWEEQDGVFISCKGTNIVASFLDSYTGPKCALLWIECPGCDGCYKEEKVCFCENSSECSSCHTCNTNGLCVDYCDGKICDGNGGCVDCDESHPCKGDKVCTGGGCQCPPDNPIDLGDNRCGQCNEASDCFGRYGKCSKCSGNKCIPITTCGDGVCDPSTGNCEQCLTSSDCAHLGPNFCCDGNKQCTCCPGYVPDGFGGCKEKPKCENDGQCGPCGQCIDGNCVPRQCPTGEICVNGDCMEQCDCNNPASCTNKGKICKNIDGSCVCVSCGPGCGSCNDGCHCEGNSCVVDKCHGTCSSALDCGSGCGCLGGLCQDCAKLSCTGTDCNQALGCECQGINCVDTSNKCSGSCQTKGDCGTGCTCHDNECVPCEYFSCATGDCAKHEGCKCNGSKCEADPDYKCKDTLTIEQFDATCDLEGHLKKTGCCGCPVITTLLDAASPVTKNQPDKKYAGTITVSLRAQLFKGNNIDEANKLKNTGNPNIALNESATDGSLNLKVITSYLQKPDGGYYPDTEVNLSVPIANGDTFTFDPITLQQNNGLPRSKEDPRIVKNVVFRLTTDNWVFPNTCRYSGKVLGEVAVLNNDFVVSITDFVSNTDCRDALFTWYKSATNNFPASSRIRTVYVPLDASGKYIDKLPDEEVNGVKYEESCNYYKLEADCSCQKSASKYVIFCKPTDFDATPKPDSCGKVVSVTIPATCHSNKNKDFELKINGVAQWTGKLWPTSPINAKEFESAVGITSVELSMICGSERVCTKTKTFTPPPAPEITPSFECYTHTDGKKYILYKFDRRLQTPKWKSLIFREGSSVVSEFTPVGDFETGPDIKYFLGLSDVEYNWVVTYDCGKSGGVIKKNCCSAFTPEITFDCSVGNTGKITVTNLYGIDQVRYTINGFSVTKEQLAGADLGQKITLPSGSSITPTTLGWETNHCGTGEVNIPSFPCCPNTVFNAVQDGNNAALIINEAYPAIGSNEKVYLQINSGPVVPYTGSSLVGVPVAATYGKVQVTIKRGNCNNTLSVTETGGLELRTSGVPCSLTSSNVSVVEDSCKYLVYTPDVDGCRCDNVVFVPEVTKVVKTNDKFLVTVDGVVVLGNEEVGVGNTPKIKKAVISVYSTKSDFKNVSTVENVDKIGFTVDVPCPIDDSLSTGFSYNLSKGKIGLDSNNNVSSVSYHVGINWPSGLGIAVSGVKVTDLKTATVYTATQNPGTGGTLYEFHTSGAFLEGHDMLIEFLLDNADVAKVTSYNSQFDATEFNAYYKTAKTVCTKCTNLVIRLLSVELSNGCSYSPNKNSERYISLDFDNLGYTICPDNTWEQGDSFWQADLVPDAPNQKVQVDFYENNTLIKTRFTDGGFSNPVVLDGSLPANIDGIEYGKSYKAVVSCGSCVVTKAMDLCLNPKITTASTICRSGAYYSDGSSALNLKLTVRGCYAGKTVSIYRGGTDEFITSVVVGGDGLVTTEVPLTESMAGLDNDFQIYAQYDAQCRSALYYVIRSEYVPQYTIDCTNSPVSYDIIFNGNPTIQIMSGGGSVLGSSIINVPNNSTVTFKGSIGGCTSKVYSVDYDCTIAPTPTPSITPTRSVTRTIQATPTITPSHTVTPSRSGFNTGGQIVFISATPSVTPTKTPSVTPSNTVSRTPNASMDPTPTITPSTTVTPSITPSMTVSATTGYVYPTPTVTPSVSITITPSHTPSVTISPSHTPSHTPSISGCGGNCPANFTGTICGGAVTCCNGVALQPGETCCGGYVINQSLGDICCTPESNPCFQSGCNCCLGNTSVDRVTGFTSSGTVDNSGPQDEITAITYAFNLAACNFDLVRATLTVEAYNGGPGWVSFSSGETDITASSGYNSGSYDVSNLTINPLGPATTALRLALHIYSNSGQDICNYYYTFYQQS